MKKILVVVDTQYDFVMPDGRLSVEGATKIITAGNTYLANLDPEEFDCVLFTFDTHTQEAYAGSEEAKQFPLHCEEGTPGWENIFNMRLVPNIPIYTLKKGVFDMWANEKIPDGQLNNANGTEFTSDIALRGIDYRGIPFHWRTEFFQTQLEAGIDTVIVWGVAADFCVKDAIKGFLNLGFKVEVPAALTHGIVRQIEQVVAEEFPEVKIIGE